MEVETAHSETVGNNSANSNIEILEAEETIFDENCVNMEEEPVVETVYGGDYSESIHDEKEFADTSTVDQDQVPSISINSEEAIVDTGSPLDTVVPFKAEGKPKNVCEYCNKKFATTSSCVKHLFNIHKVQRKVMKTDIICIECKIPYKRVSQLREHLSQLHKLEMGEEVYHFTNINEFRKWKCEEERRNLCTYVMKQGIKKCKTGARYFYVCHRSGKHVTKVKNRKRNMKAQGTCKLGMSCTSAITVVDSGHEVVAKYCKHHYGHGGVTTLIKISPQEQDAIAATVEKGVSFKNVLEEIRGSFSERDHFQYHILQRKDFQRIKKALATDGPNLDMTDSESLDLWVQSCCQMENSPVLLYRPESFFGEDKSPDSGFALVIMTEYQKHILLASAKKIVCVDRIHRRKGSRYYVTVLFVMDEYNLGFPTAFCVSSKVDKYMMLQFFDAIKQTTGCLETDYFMSDGEEYFFEAWREVMNTDTKWLWNTWFVDCYWRGQLRIFKGNIEKRGEVYNNMRSLMECQSDSVFTSMLETFIKTLSEDDETKDLGKYLEQHYAPAAYMWAYCYRKDLGIGTSIHLEILHRTMRFCTREGFKQRLDKYIFVLMKLVRDKILDRLSKIEKDKLSLALANIGWCHKAGLEIPAENVLPFSEKEWNIKSPLSDEKFHITLDNESCPEHCNLICEECDICVHMFTCTCYDNLINANLCEHIHAVAITCLVPKFTPPQSPMQMEDDLVAIEENIIDVEHIPKTSNEFLYKTLKRTHNLYKKIKSSKCNLSSYALQRITENINECMDICDGKLPLEKAEDKKTELKDLSNFTMVAPINNISGINTIAGLCPPFTTFANVNTGQMICTPINSLTKTNSIVQTNTPIPDMLKKEISKKKKRKSNKRLNKAEDEVSKISLTTNANVLKLDTPTENAVTNLKNVAGTFIPISSIANINSLLKIGTPLNSLTNIRSASELGTPIKILTVTTSGLNASTNANAVTQTSSTNLMSVVRPANAFKNVNTTAEPIAAGRVLQSFKTLAGTGTSVNKLANTVFAIVTPISTSSDVKPTVGANVISSTLNVKSSASSTLNVRPLSAPSILKLKPLSAPSTLNVNQSCVPSTSANIIKVSGVDKPAKTLTTLKYSAVVSSNIKLVAGKQVLAVKDIKTVPEKNISGSEYSTNAYATARKTFTNGNKRTVVRQETAKIMTLISNENAIPKSTLAQNNNVSTPYILLLPGK